MNNFFEKLKIAYSTRDFKLIPELMTYIDNDCFVIGTSFGEFNKGKDKVQELFEDDLKYWIDLSIDVNYNVKQVGQYSIYQLNAIGLYNFCTNEKYYQRYCNYMQEIRESQKDAYSKAIKAIWELDHVLASKPKVRRIDYKKFLITIIEKNNLIKLIAFENVKFKNHIDCVACLEDDIDFCYLQDFNSLDTFESLNKVLIEQLSFDDLKFTELKAVKEEDIFIGCGKLLNNENIETEINLDFKWLDKDSSSYEKLYNLRKSLGETLRLYTVGNTQEIMIRFFGIIVNDKILYSHHSYPFYWLFED